jgi:hypothetical protein
MQKLRLVRNAAVERPEAEVWRAEAQVKLAEIRRAEKKAKEPPEKEVWWRSSQITLLLIGGNTDAGRKRRSGDLQRSHVS